MTATDNHNDNIELDPSQLKQVSGGMNPQPEPPKQARGSQQSIRTIIDDNEKTINKNKSIL